MIYTFFSLDIYDKLSIRSKELLIDKKEYLKTFSLGNIPLSYNKKYKDLYEEINNKKEELLTTLINYIKYNNYEHSKQVMAYLYGMIINYNVSNIKSYNEVDRYNIVNNHIDNYLIRQKMHINPYRFKGYKYCFNVDYFDKDLKEVIDFTYKEVSNIENFSKIYLDSIKKMKRFYKIFRYDRFGIKKIFYFKNRYLSLHTKSNDDLSFIDSYLSNLYDTTNMINDINKYIYYDKKINLNKILKKKD